MRKKIAILTGGGGDIILIPEFPYDINIVAKKDIARNRNCKRFTIVVVTEGARPEWSDP